MSDQRKAVIKNADMDEKMQQDAVDIASKALSEYNIEKVRRRGATSLQNDEMCDPLNHNLTLIVSSRMLQLISRRNSTGNIHQHGK